MEGLFQLTITASKPELCSACPRRGFISKFLAQTLLGPNHLGTNCNPENIVHDGELKNYLYIQGVVDSPFGLSATPDHVNGTAVNFGGSPRTRAMHAASSIQFGFSDRVCPQDVPETYEGDFAAFIAKTQEEGEA